jgi:hypothetical protein
VREVEYGTVGDPGRMPGFLQSVPSGWSITAGDGHRHGARTCAAHDHAREHGAPTR